MKIRVLAYYLALFLVGELLAQTSTITPEQIEKMVDDIVAEAEKEGASVPSSDDASAEFPTKVCRERFRVKAAECAQDASCKNLAKEQMRLCIEEAIKSASKDDPKTVVDRAQEAFAAAKTLDECQQALLIRQTCGVHKDCRDKILEGFNNCGKRVNAVMKEGGATSEIQHVERKAKAMALLTTEDLRKIKLQQEIEHLKARNRALRIELERAQTTIQLYEENYKARQLKKIRGRDEMRTKKANKEILRKDLIALAAKSTEESKAYQMSAKAITDYKRLADVAGLLLKLRDAEAKVKKLYTQWLPVYKEKIDSVETFLRDIVTMQKNISEHIRGLEGTKKSDDVKSKAEREFLVIVNSYLDSMKLVQDRAMKATQFSEAERSLSDLEQMLEQTQDAYKKFEAHYKSKVAEADAKILEMSGMITNVRNHRDKLIAQKPL